MKIPTLTIALFSALMVMGPMDPAFAQNQIFFSSADAEMVYNQLVKESEGWEEIDGVKVDPDLEIDSPEALKTRLEKGHILTTVDPASGQITRVSKLVEPVRIQEH